MIKLNTTYGVRAWNNKNKKAQPPAQEPAVSTRQLTLEEIIHYDKIKPPDRTNRYGTTAYQRPMLARKPKSDIWGEE